MYFLRPGHEAIDCLIANETDDGRRRVHLIQLLLQEYEKLKSKSTAVYKSIPETMNASIVDYYLMLAGADEVSYIYTSLCELNDDVLINRMYEKHYPVTTRRSHDSERTHVLLGGIRSDSATSQLIMEVMDHVN
jgi:hypothetical protein